MADRIYGKNQYYCPNVNFPKFASNLMDFLKMFKIFNKLYIFAFDSVIIKVQGT